MNTRFDLRLLDSVSVDMKQLSTNIEDVLCGDCPTDIQIRSELQDRYPLASWLMDTPLAKRLNSVANNGFCNLRKEGSDYVITTPTNIWTTPQTSTTDCCWIPYDFAACGSNVPVKLLCLKDCDDIMDSLVANFVNANEANMVGGLVFRGETLKEVKDRIAKLSMAYHSAATIVLGGTTYSTDLIKPFHGLMEVLENPAVTSITASDILGAFEILACRLAVLGTTNFVIAVHPVTFQAIKSVVTPGQYGEYPIGWAVNGNSYTFNGISFIEDKMVPVDLDAATGEAWVLNGEYVGAFMGTSLIPSNDWIRKSGLNQADGADCGSECTYYYNFGAVVNTNANMVAKIVELPLSTNCISALGTLSNLMTPNTLIPQI